jgi:hypothetical protein
MSGPFSGYTSCELFICNRCVACVHRTVENDPCDEFTPAYLGEWPEMLLKDEDSFIGVECVRFSRGNWYGSADSSHRLA